MVNIKEWAKRVDDVLDNETTEFLIEWLEIHRQLEAENRWNNLEEKVRKLKKYYKNLKKKYERR